ncbi:SDR family oxidoreductase [Agromyces sp. NPDC055520]
MHISVIGGTGLIGTRLVARLVADGHDVVAASRATGVNSYTDEGLAAALVGAQALIDVSNSDYLDEAAANEFFSGSTLNLLSYGAGAGVAHHVALSVVGTDRLAASEGGYFAAKATQERLIRQSGRPYSIVHATQFFEFIANIADAGTSRNVVPLSRAHGTSAPISASASCSPAPTRRSCRPDTRSGSRPVGGRTSHSKGARVERLAHGRSRARFERARGQSARGVSCRTGIRRSVFSR